MRRSMIAMSAGAVFLAACAAAPTRADDVYETSHGPVRLTTIAQGLEHPWGMTFLPDGRILVTERPGRLRIVSTEGELSEPLTGLPEIRALRQGGLLDVVLDPAFDENRRIYFSFAEPGEGSVGTAVARGRLEEGGLADVEVIFRQRPKLSGGQHFGSRLVFARDGTLFVTLGDRGQADRAQLLGQGQGKLMRIEADGSIPDDNPFVGREGAQPEIWSYGHRNIQGAALHPETGKLWLHEHGARGGDEINVPEAGRNYGWPVISYGTHYSGAKIGEGTHKEGMEQPIHYWDPSIAPSGMVFYTGDVFPEWRGDLLVGGLAIPMLSRLELDGQKVVSEERILEEWRERIRDVRQGPDGHIYLLTDTSDGRLVRLDPAW